MSPDFFAILQVEAGDDSVANHHDSAVVDRGNVNVTSFCDLPQFVAIGQVKAAQDWFFRRSQQDSIVDDNRSRWAPPVIQ